MSVHTATDSGTGPPADPPVLASFAPLVGETFTARFVDGAIDLELIEAKALTALRAAPRQDPFSLLFRAAPEGTPLGQGMVRLEHASLRARDLFLVPLAPDADGRYFEAIFN